MARRERSRRASGGFSLLELTIALAIFSTGLGGFSLLLMLAIQGSTASQLRTIAAIEAESLAHALRLVPGARTEALSFDSSPPCPDGVPCTPEQIAASEIHDWRQRLEKRIPGSEGVVCLDSTPDDGRVGAPLCDGAGSTAIKVFWIEPAKDGTGGVQHRRLVSLQPRL